MRGKLTLMILAPVCAVAYAAEDGANLLGNAGFEETDEKGWARGWEIWPTALPEAGAVAIDGEVAHSGGHSLRLAHKRATSYTRAQQVLSVEPNTRYLFTFWVRADDLQLGDGSQGARLYVEKSTGDRASAKQYGSFEWKQVRLGPIDSGNATRFTVMCYLHRATGTVWFDDITCLKVTPQVEKELAREHIYQRLNAELDIARSAATEAADEKCLATLAGIEERILKVEAPEELDYRAGPPYFGLHAEIFDAMARMNARRLPEGTRLAAWVSDPFETMPALGLVPEESELAASALMGREEREQLAVTLCNLTDEPLPVQVALGGFAGDRAPGALLREVFHVPGRGGDLMADPLPRLESGASLTLPPGLFKQVWVDISSVGAEAGEYEGALILGAAGAPQIEVTLNVHLLPLALPAEKSIITWGYSYQTWPLIKDRWEQASDDLVAHHINAYCWPSAYLPWPEFDQAGRLQPLNWSKFDAGLDSHQSIKWLLLWPGFEWEGNLKLRQELEPGSEDWERKFIAWFQAMIAGLRERGFGYDRVAWYLADEPITWVRAEAVRMAGEAIRKADPEALIVENPYSAAPWSVLNTMQPVVDIWCPALSWAEGEHLEFFRENSKILWTYQVLGKTDAFASYRLSFWDCWDKGMTGQGFWDYADCGGSVWNPRDGKRHDYAVIYDDDPEELIPSKRWEAWREGVEDYTYLWMLREAIAEGRGTEAQRSAAQSLLGELPARVVGQRTPQALGEARRSLLRALAAMGE